jgi:mRNA-degrading endonuclease toxin of MazEF toxin-antitoxin module
VLGPEDGLDRQSVANLDDVMTILVDDLGPQIGGLSPPKEAALAAAVFHAFELSW